MLVTADLVNIEAIADAGTKIAEKSADYVVDLLCGCGCRLVNPICGGLENIRGGGCSPPPPSKHPKSQ